MRYLDVSECCVCRLCGRLSLVQPLPPLLNGFSLLSCAECTVVYADLPSGPSVADSATYDQLFDSSPTYRQHLDEYQQLLNGHLPRQHYRDYLLWRLGRMTHGRRLTEIGGGTGAFGTLAARRGWKHTGWDVSARVVDMCQRLGLDSRLFSPTAPPPVPPGSTDVVVAWEVLEHVLPVASYLKTIRQALAPDGIIALSVPNAPLHYLTARPQLPGASAPPIHVNFFTRASLARVLTLSGFDQVTVFHKRAEIPSGSLGSLARSLARLAGIRPASTLVAIARAP